jgi:inner membrane protein
MVNPFRWYGVVETGSAYDRVDVNSITPEVDPANRAEIRLKSQPSDVVTAAKSSYLGRVYMGWAACPVTEVEQVESDGGGYIVRFYDLRYLYPDSRMRPLSAWVRLSPQLKVVDEDFGVRNYPRRSSQ